MAQSENRRFRLADQEARRPLMLTIAERALVLFALKRLGNQGYESSPLLADALDAVRATICTACRGSGYASEGDDPADPDPCRSCGGSGWRR